MHEFDEDFYLGFRFGLDGGDPRRENVDGVSISEPPNRLPQKR